MCSFVGSTNSYASNEHAVNYRGWLWKQEVDGSMVEPQASVYHAVPELLIEQQRQR